MASRHGYRSDAGRRNQRSVLREIVLSGPASRTKIAGRTGLTAGAVSRITRPLIDAGLVRELPGGRGDAQVGPGRRFVPLDIDPQGGQVLGIGIGPSGQTLILANIANEIIAGTDIELDTIEDPDLVIRRVAQESRRLIGAHLDDRSRLLGGLLTITGPVDPVRGDTPGAPYLGWGPYPVRASLAELLDLPVKVQSMTATIARAESLFGATRGWNNVLTLLCGLGVGAAVIVDGHLAEGGRNPSGGIGGMEVTGEDGTVATLDQLGSGLGVLQRLHGDDMTPARAPLPRIAHALLDAVERERAGDPDVARLMAGAGRELGRAIVPFARLAAPEVVLIAGPLSLSPAYMAAAGEAVAEKMSPHAVEVIASTVTGPVSGWSASCAMAICEYLLERPLEL